MVTETSKKIQDIMENLDSGIANGKAKTQARQVANELCEACDGYEELRCLADDAVRCEAWHTLREEELMKYCECGNLITSRYASVGACSLECGEKVTS